MSNCQNHDMGSGIALTPSPCPPSHRDYGRRGVTIWDGKYGWELSKVLKCRICGFSKEGEGRG